MKGVWNMAEKKVSSSKKEVKKEPEKKVTEKKVTEEKVITKAAAKENKLTQEKLNNICLIAGIVVLVAVLVIFYFSRVGSAKRAERISASYLLTSETISLEIKSLAEVSQTLNEVPNEYFVLISYTKNQDTYNLEKGLKDIIDKYNLSDRFYYLNVTNLKEEDNYLEQINNAFNTNNITAIPTILYYKDGKLVDLVKRADNNIINAGDFQQLLDIYEIGQ